MIDGVQVKLLKVISDERGYLMEMLRADDPIFEKFGQVYLTVAYPGVVKAWHYHRKQTDYFAVVRGMAKVVLHDAREESPTHGETQELYMGEHAPMLLKIPPRVMHGFKAVGGQPAYLVNCPTEPYDRENPDEFRLPPDSPEVGYNWDVKHG